MSNCCKSGCDCEALKCDIDALKANQEELFNRTDSIKAYLEGEQTAEVIVAFTADQGEYNASQITLAQTINSFSPRFAIFGGDNNYGDGEFDTLGQNWSVFEEYITSKRAYPVFGNHDLDSTPPGLPQLTIFPYLPNNRRFYDIEVPEVGTHFFFLNSGVDSDRDLIESEGNTLGSSQYKWLEAKVEASPHKRLIAVFHHPFVSTRSDKILAAMDWGWDDIGGKAFTALLVGHTHVCEHILNDGVHIINASGSVRGIVAGDGSLHGGNSPELQWENTNTSKKFAVKLKLRKDYVVVSYVNTSTLLTEYSFTIED